MTDLAKYGRIIQWLIDQRDKAKAAWSIVVLLAGLLGYQSVVTPTEKNETLDRQICPIHNIDHGYMPEDTGL